MQDLLADFVKLEFITLGRFLSVMRLMRDDRFGAV
jgi:hypothetical protein